MIKLLAEVLFLSLGSMNTISANEISDLKRKFKKLKTEVCNHRWNRKAFTERILLWKKEKTYNY
ncbi:hypothetical protein LEP1GSC170_3135 [Leptospira interrogans serovar Bataviae str. HAI135]|nr:hypothetical protein LEP1GSC170_3135 [Leptospira interrogans serovar Bataviae str. HAI135]